MTGPGTTSRSSSGAGGREAPSCYADSALRQGHLLEQYKLAVEMAHNISSMRQSANNYYIGILSAFALLYSMLEKVPSPAARDALAYGIPIIAVVLCVMWGLLLASYRRINAAKYEVIIEMEAELPAAPYAREWEKLRGLRGAHLHLTKIEAAVPVLFGLAFVALILKSVLSGEL